MSRLATQLDAARRAAIASTGLQRQSSVAASSSSVLTPNIFNVPAATSSVTPQRISPEHIIFRTFKTNLNTCLPDLTKVSFVDRHYQTKDAKIIAFLRENAKAFGLSEV